MDNLILFQIITSERHGNKLFIANIDLDYSREKEKKKKKTLSGGSNFQVWYAREKFLRRGNKSAKRLKPQFIIFTHFLPSWANSGLIGNKSREGWIDVRKFPQGGFYFRLFLPTLQYGR